MKKFLFIFLVIFLYSCNKQNEESYLNGFDISTDNENIVFSYKIDSLYRIYLKPVKGGRAITIFKGSGNYINPRYNNNGKILISLFYRKNSFSPEFHFYDLNTHRIIKKIKVDDGFIVDYTIPYEDKIFYLQAKDFKSYSLLAPKAYHDFDIYELDMTTSVVKRISNLNLYYMRNILKIGKDSLLVSTQGETSNESGLFIFNTNLARKGGILLNKIKIKNDTLRNSSMYTNPIILSNDIVLCASSYQLMKLDLKTSQEHQVLPSTGYHYNTIRNRGDLIFYQQNDNTNIIYYFNLLDKKINSIDLSTDIN